MLEQSQAKINMRFANSRDHLARPVIQYAVEIAPDVDETEASVKGICIDVSSNKEQQQGLTGSNCDSVTDNEEYITSQVTSSATMMVGQGTCSYKGCWRRDYRPT